MSSSARKPPSKWGPRWARWVGRFIAKVMYRTSVGHKERVPRKGAAILVANHVGFADGPVVFGVVPRTSHFLVADHMFKGALGVILTGAGQIRVDKSGREALARGLAVLRRGGAVGVFPEGTRGAGDAESVHGGAAWLAVQSGAPVIAVALLGTRHAGESVSGFPPLGRRIHVEFAEPFHLDIDASLRGRDRQAAAAEQLAQALRKHVAEVSERVGIALPGDDPRANERATA